LIEKPVSYEYNASRKDITYTYRSSDKLFRITVGISCYNRIVNIKTVQYANYSENPTFATVINTTGDWFSGLRLKATTGDNEVASKLVVSCGNHGRGGGANGYRTARNKLFCISIDGSMIDMSVDSSGTCDYLHIHSISGVRASNTVDSQPITHNGETIVFTGETSDPVWLDEYIEPLSTIRREVVDHVLNIGCSAFGMSVESKIIKHEPVLIFSDYALQLFTSGFDTSIMFVDGQYRARQPFTRNQTSGRNSAYPDAWAVVLKGSAGMCVSWIDKKYGQGDGCMIASSRENINSGVGTNSKVYQGVVKDRLVGRGQWDYENGGIELPDDYKWRGGFIWSVDTASDNFDSVFPLVAGLEKKIAYIKHDGTSLCR